MTTTTAQQTAQSDLALPPDTYIYSLAKQQTFYAAISSNDALTFFDPDSLTTSQQIKNANQGLTCLCSAPDGHGVLTAGRDGVIRCWDEQAGKAAVEIRNPRETGFSALAVEGTRIAAGTESMKEGIGEVSVLVWDKRQPTTPLRHYTDSHTDTITALSFHPTSLTTLLSASTDGLVSLFDTTIADEDDALARVLNHGGGVHCAGFTGEDEVYALSSDERLGLYEIGRLGGVDEGRAIEAEGEGEGEAAAVWDLGDVREPLGCAYVVDVVLATGNEAGMWVAAGDASRAALALTPLKRSAVLGSGKVEWAFEHTKAVTFPGAHGEEIVRDILLDAEHNRILTCGEDGHVRLWSMPQSRAADAMDVEDSMADVELGKSKKARKEKKKKEKVERFKPY